MTKKTIAAMTVKEQPYVAAAEICAKTTRRANFKMILSEIIVSKFESTL